MTTNDYKKAAKDLLDNLENGELITLDKLRDMGLGSWHSVTLTLPSEEFCGEVPESAEPFMEKMQESVYRIYTMDASESLSLNLSEKEERNLRINVEVTSGCTILSADMLNVANNIINLMRETGVGPREIVWTVLGIGGMYFSSESLNHYITEKQRTARYNKLLDLASSIFGDKEKQREAADEAMEHEKHSDDLHHSGVTTTAHLENAEIQIGDVKITAVKAAVIIYQKSSVTKENEMQNKLWG